MNALPWVLLGAALIAAGWLAWRHRQLVQAIRAYARRVRENAREAEASDRSLEGVAEAVRALARAGEEEHAALERERARLAAVLDQMPDGVLIANVEGEIEYSNPAAGQLFRVENPVGRRVVEVVWDPRLLQAWERSRAGAGLQTEAAEIPARGQYLQLVTRPDEHGGGSLLLVQDLTRVRRLETVRQDFVSNISHDLRTPLASLRALAETLQEGALRDPEAGPRFLERMITEVDALTQLSQELLELSAIESGAAQLRLEAVEPERLLRSAADRLRLQAERGGLSMKVDAQPALPRVRADFNRLEQVLVNLLHNAIKFTPAGGEIVLAARLEGDAVRFSVSDTGRGIASEDLPRIFERFYRGDKARSKGGAGLGLSIARHLVEAHGGKLQAESVEGQGSTFSFTIPLSQ